MRLDDDLIASFESSPPSRQTHPPQSPPPHQSPPPSHQSTPLSSTPIPALSLDTPAGHTRARRSALISPSPTLPASIPASSPSSSPSYEPNSSGSEFVPEGFLPSYSQLDSPQPLLSLLDPEPEPGPSPDDVDPPQAVPSQPDPSQPGPSQPLPRKQSRGRQPKYPLRNIFKENGLCYQLANLIRLALRQNLAHGALAMKQGLMSVYFHELDHQNASASQRRKYHKYCKKHQNCKFYIHTMVENRSADSYVWNK